MKDGRALYRNRLLGDALADTLASLSASQAQGQSAFGATVQSLANAEAVHPSPYTDYSQGVLNGWIRQWGSTGAYSTVPAPYGPGTNGQAPSAQDWRNFDAVANQLGVGGLVAADRRSAMSAGSNFFDKVGAAINTALIQFDQTITRPTVHTVAQATAALDHYVPGWATLVDALYPVLPFVPAITSALAAVSGVSSSLVAQAFDTVASGTSAAIHASSATPLSVLPLGEVNAQVLAPLESSAQSAIADAVTKAAQAGISDVNALANVQASLLKALATASTTRGNAINGLAAAGIEAAQGVILVLQVAATVAGPEAAVGLQSLSLALKATLTAATATGDAGQVAAAVGFVIAKGLPAILLGVGASTMFAPVAQGGLGLDASAPVLVGGTDITNADGVVSATVDPLFSTTLGTLVRGTLGLEATAIQTAAAVGQVALAQAQLVQAAKASRASVVADAGTLDAEIARLQAQLAALHAKRPAVASASPSLAPLALFAGLALVLGRVMR